MKIRPEQLSDQLRHGLSTVYLVHGDEPLQAGECADLIRHSARQQGFGERETVHVDKDFDWRSLAASAMHGSLFSDKRLIDLRLGDARPGKDGGRALTAYAGQPAADTALLITCSKLEAASQKSAWFNAVDKAGITLQIWPVGASQLPGWLDRRLRGKGLNASPEALQWLAARLEGNLLAAAQEVDKLFLLHGGGSIGISEVTAAVADSARHSVYDLADAAMAGDPARTTRVLAALRNDATEPLIVLWALARELRQLSRLQGQVASGVSLSAAMDSERVWKNRKPRVAAALRRLSAAHLAALTRECSRLDQMIKGVLANGETEPEWDALQRIVLTLAGRPILRRKSG